MADVVQPAMHGRDHCPGGADPIPCWPGDRPWARLGSGSASAAQNTWTNVKFTQAMSYNEAEVGAIFTLDDQGDRFRLILEADGLYLVHGIFAWDDTFSEFRAVDLQQGLGDHLYSEGYGLVNTCGPFPSTGGPFFNVNTVSSFIFKSQSVATPDPTIDPRCYQSSSATRGCQGYSVRVIYLGPIGAEASWEFLTT